MNAYIQHRPLSISYLLRWSGRLSGVCLFASWVGFVFAELFREGVVFRGLSLIQACALVVVFAGYGLGWRWELAGGVLTLLGTAAFFVVRVLTLTVLPDPAAAWFAAPGALYLLAWSFSYRFGRAKSTSRMRWDRQHSEDLFFERLRKRTARRATSGRASVAGRV